MAGTSKHYSEGRRKIMAGYGMVNKNKRGSAKGKENVMKRISAAKLRTREKGTMAASKNAVQKRNAYLKSI